jgi:hypothetical protein
MLGSQRERTHPAETRELSAGQLPLAVTRDARTLVTAPRPAPVLLDGMDQPGQRVHVDVIEPTGREAHHVLFFVLAVARFRPDGEAENPVLFFPAARHDFTPEVGAGRPGC